MAKVQILNFDLGIDYRYSGSAINYSLVSNLVWFIPKSWIQEVSAIWLQLRAISVPGMVKELEQQREQQGTYLVLLSISGVGTSDDNSQPEWLIALTSMWVILSKL